MDVIYQFISREVVEAIGWTLFHSLWQILAVAILLAIVLASFDAISAAAKYFIAYASIVIIAGWSSVTFIQSYKAAREKAELRKEIMANPMIVVEHFRESLQNHTNLSTQHAEKPTLNIKWLLVKAYFQRNFPVIVVIWFVGLLFFLLRFAGGLWFISRLRHKQLTAIDESWAVCLHNFSNQLNIHKPVRIFQSQLAQMPLTLGFFKPVILLPTSALTGLSVQHIESIIAHELGHIARRDYLLNIFQSVFEIVFFYHPAIWWISSIIRTERENCCDDIAVKLTGDSIHYAKTLALVQENVLLQQSLAMAFGAKKNQLLKRIKRILNPQTMKNNLTEGIVASCIILAGIVGMAFSVIPNAAYDLKQSSGTEKTKTTVQPGPNYLVKDTARKSKKEYREQQEQTTQNEYNQQEVSKLLKEINTSDAIPKDLQKELEVALSNLNSSDNIEILKGIKGAMKEMDLTVIVGEALKGAQAAVNNMDVNVIVNEAMKDANKDGNTDVDHDKIVKEALKGADAALKNMDLNKIVNEALKGVDGALKEMDLNKLVQESMDKNIEINDNLPSAENVTNKYTAIILKGPDEWNKWRNENQMTLPNLSYQKIQDAKLAKANLSEMLFKETIFNNTDLTDGNLQQVTLDNAGFYDTRLNNANLEYARITDCRFKDCPMQDASFENATINNSTFEDCDLSGCDFRKADIRGASFEESKLDNCNFKGAKANHETRFPAGFDPKAHGIRMEE